MMAGPNDRVNQLIHEYLVYGDFRNSIKTFEKEAGIASDGQLEGDDSGLENVAKVIESYFILILIVSIHTLIHESIV